MKTIPDECVLLLVCTQQYCAPHWWQFFQTLCMLSFHLQIYWSHHKPTQDIFGNSYRRVAIRCACVRMHMVLRSYAITKSTTRHSSYWQFSSGIVSVETGTHTGMPAKLCYINSLHSIYFSIIQCKQIGTACSKSKWTPSNRFNMFCICFGWSKDNFDYLGELMKTLYCSMKQTAQYGQYLNSAPPFSCIVVYIGINNLLKTEAKDSKHN